MSRCTQCGASIKSGSTSCEYCGTHVEAGELESVLGFHEAQDKRQEAAAREAREHEAERERYRDRESWKSIVLMLALPVLFWGFMSLTATDADRNTTAVPQASNEFEGRDYQDVQTDLRAAGFTSIETSALDDLKTGWLKKPGTVKEVSINGRTDFSADDDFPTDAKIVIRYHSLPKDE